MFSFAWGPSPGARLVAMWRLSLSLKRSLKAGREVPGRTDLCELSSQI